MVRPKEFWIKGKRINSDRYKAAIKRQVEKTIKQEIKYVSSFFPYNIEKFHNRSLLYFQSIFLTQDLAENCFSKDEKVAAAKNGGSAALKDPDLAGMRTKLVNLIVGLELLSIGTAFHDFKASGSSLDLRDSSREIEKEYTLDLLFGDIFYSRAVIFLLRYGDHSVFDRILAALKELHESRLKLHQKIRDLLKEDREPSNLDMDTEHLIKANKLLDISLDISFNIFCKNTGRNEKARYSGLTSHIILLRTYDELLKYLKSLKGNPSAEKVSAYLASKKNFTDSKLSDIISESDSGPFRTRVNTLIESLNK